MSEGRQQTQSAVPVFDQQRRRDFVLIHVHNHNRSAPRRNQFDFWDHANFVVECDACLALAADRLKPAHVLAKRSHRFLCDSQLPPAIVALIPHGKEAIGARTNVE